MKHLCLAAAWALLAGTGHAQAPATPPTVCSQPGDMAPSQLYGLWQLALWPQEGGSEAAPASTGALLFERHPEYPDSVRGSLIGIGIGDTVSSVFAALLALFVPATIIVALKTVFSTIITSQKK